MYFNDRGPVPEKKPEPLPRETLAATIRVPGGIGHYSTQDIEIHVNSAFLDRIAALLAEALMQRTKE